MINTGGDEQRLLIHLETPGPLLKDVAIFLHHEVTTAAGTTGIDFSYSITALTEDFDPDDNGTPTPRNNTWNDPPSTAGTMALSLAVDAVSFTGTYLSLVTAAIDPSWYLSNLGGRLTYGLEIAITNLTVYGGGTYSITTTLGTGAGINTFSHAIKE